MQEQMLTSKVFLVIGYALEKVSSGGVGAGACVSGMTLGQVEFSGY